MKLDTHVDIPSKKDLYIFSAALAILLAAIACWQISAGRQIAAIILGSGSVITLVFMAIKVDYLIPVYRVLMIISRAISLVLTPIIFGIIYYLLFTPAGVIMRMLGDDPFDRDFKEAAETFWVKKEETSPHRETYERQF